jgi:hypothetical protein
MTDNARRKFAKGLGLTGLFLAGIAGYKEATERIVYKQDELPTKELEEQLNTKPVLQLTATYGEELPPGNYLGHPYYVFSIGPRYKEGTEKKVDVKLVPGPDGKLYVKENDIWRKV